MVYKIREVKQDSKKALKYDSRLKILDVKIEKAKELIILEHKKLNEKKLKDALKIKAKLIKKIKKGIKTLINDSSKRDMEDLKK